MSRSISKPMLGLLVGGTLGLVDGLTGFLAPQLADKMFEVITVSTGKGLLCGLIMGLVANKWRSLPLGILTGLVIAAFLSYLVVLRAGHELARDIMLPGMLLGMIVGFATQKFGRAAQPAEARH